MTKLPLLSPRPSAIYNSEIIHALIKTPTQGTAPINAQALGIQGYRKKGKHELAGGLSNLFSMEDVSNGDKKSLQRLFGRKTSNKSSIIK